MVSKSPSEPTNHEDTLKDLQLKGWKKELEHRVHVWQDDFDTFLSTCVPTSAPPVVPLPPGYETAFRSYDPQKGKEFKAYPGLLKGLRKIVSKFPKEKKPSFYANHREHILFPFSAFQYKHHAIAPDLAVSAPGLKLREANWCDTAMFIEVKDLANKDPFGKGGLDHCKTLVQMAVDARGLVDAHGLLAAFVIGVFGQQARIARYDHSGVVASPSFSLIDAPDKLAKFYWRFVHPVAQGVPFVGCDPTTRRLEAQELAWIQQRLRLAKEDALITDLLLCRRTEVYNARNATKPSNAYFLLRLIDVNARLLSHSTAVWLSMPDPRTLAADGTLSDFPKPSADPIDLAIIKESWRQIVRRSEMSFYDRLEAAIPDEEWYGLPRLLYGCDLGEVEAGEWKTGTEDVFETYLGKGKATDLSSLHNHEASAEPPAAMAVPPGAASSSLYPFRRAPVEPRTPTTCTPPDFSSPLTPLSSEMSSEDGSQMRDSSPCPPAICSSESALPPPYPQQQTFTWRVMKGTERADVALERSHMRLVIDTVGRRLTHFRSTREAMSAMRDAIQGHRLAWEKAKVLHRDVSVGNILIVEKPRANSWAGFLHDFDYSAMDDLQTEMPGDSKPGQSTSVLDTVADPTRTKDCEAALKERTGTYYFMARDLLLHPGIVHTVSHDLESYFWVLIWIVLRHTAHEHPQGDFACSTTFQSGNDRASAGEKTLFFQDGPFSVKDNKPLTYLIEQFYNLVDYHLDKRNPVPLTHEAVLKVFDEALEMDGWPEGDEALPLNLVDDRTKTVYGTPNNGSSTKGSKRKRPDGASGSSKRSKASKRTGSAGSTRDSSHTSNSRPRRNTSAANSSRGGKARAS